MYEDNPPKNPKEIVLLQTKEKQKWKAKQTAATNKLIKSWVLDMSYLKGSTANL